MGRFKSLGSLKSFLCYAPQLSGASTLCFLILSFLRAHRQGWLQSLMTAGDILFLKQLNLKLIDLPHVTNNSQELQKLEKQVKQPLKEAISQI